MPNPDAHRARLAQLGRILESRMGWSLAPDNACHIEHALRDMARYKGLSDTRQCLDWLIEDDWTPEKADCCAWFMTVGETYFFRERRAFDLIVECARARFADPARAAAPLRVWSAGCCTGEEPYSAAMALLEAFPGLRPDAVSILATDVSKRNLQAAHAGLYRNWSFRGSAARIRDRYFSQDGEGLLRIGDQVREMVRFAELNLALPCYPSPANGTTGIDVILCRNVLMYFTPAQRRLVVQRLRASLADGGWLVVNASEASTELFEGFTSTCYPDAIHYRKAATASPAPAPQPRASLRPAAAPPVRTARTLAVRKAARASVGTDSVAAPPGDDARLEELRAVVAHAIGAGDSERARVNLQNIIFLEPLDVAAHYMMGIVLEEMGRSPQARRKFEVAAQLLEGAGDAHCVPGTDGLPAAYLRASLRTLLDRGERL